MKTPIGTDENHHLMRVRVSNRLFEQFKSIAQQESDVNGEYISVSDLVRAAMGSYVQVHSTRTRLENRLNPKAKVEINSKVKKG